MTTTYCPSDREVQFHTIDYSVCCIKKIMRDYYTLKESSLYSTNFELVSVLADIDNSIERCGLTEAQHKIIEYYAKGFTEADIGKIFNTSQQNVHKVVYRACTKISEYLSEVG